MAKAKVHSDPAAKRIWERCRSDRNLRWLLEGVLENAKPALGRVLLLSPIELFGETQARVGRLPIRFRLSGLPYISGSLNHIFTPLSRYRRGRQSTQSWDTEKAISEWEAANSRQAQYLAVAAILETARRNPQTQALASSTEVITPARVAQVVPELKNLDWKPMEDLFQVFEPFLARPRSRKPINRFTLNLTSVLRYLQPEITLQGVAIASAHHFVGLLRKRSVAEDSWRDLLVALIKRNFVAPYLPVFLWCRKFPEDGFAASTSLSCGTLPPCCPWCGKDAHAVASFAPSGYLRDAMTLKDGLLGAAVGWHLIRKGISFSHGSCEMGTEMDFVPIIDDGHLLIECKLLSVMVPAKQLLRNVREAVKQLDRHTALLEKQGKKLRGSVCVLNLTHRNLASLWRDGPPVGIPEKRVVSYERFSDWLRRKTEEK
jgi:hypothetical protein